MNNIDYQLKYSKYKKKYLKLVSRYTNNRNNINQRGGDGEKMVYTFNLNGYTASKLRTGIKYEALEGSDRRDWRTKNKHQKIILRLGKNNPNIYLNLYRQKKDRESIRTIRIKLLPYYSMYNISNILKYSMIKWDESRDSGLINTPQPINLSIMDITDNKFMSKTESIRLVDTPYLYREYIRPTLVQMYQNDTNYIWLSQYQNYNGPGTEGSETHFYRDRNVLKTITIADEIRFVLVPAGEYFNDSDSHHCLLQPKAINKPKICFDENQQFLPHIKFYLIYTQNDILNFRDLNKGHLKMMMEVRTQVIQYLNKEYGFREEEIFIYSFNSSIQAPVFHFRVECVKKGEQFYIPLFHLESMITIEKIIIHLQKETMIQAPPYSEVTFEYIALEDNLKFMNIKEYKKAHEDIDYDSFKGNDYKDKDGIIIFSVEWYDKLYERIGKKIEDPNILQSQYNEKRLELDIINKELQTLVKPDLPQGNINFKILDGIRKLNYLIVKVRFTDGDDDDESIRYYKMVFNIPKFELNGLQFIEWFNNQNIIYGECNNLFQQFSVLKLNDMTDETFENMKVYRYKISGSNYQKWRTNLVEYYNIPLVSKNLMPYIDIINKKREAREENYKDSPDIMIKELPLDYVYVTSMKDDYQFIFMVILKHTNPLIREIIKDGNNGKTPSQLLEILGDEKRLQVYKNRIKDKNPRRLMYGQAWLINHNKNTDNYVSGLRDLSPKHSIFESQINEIKLYLYKTFKVPVHYIHSLIQYPNRREVNQLHVHIFMNIFPEEHGRIGMDLYNLEQLERQTRLSNLFSFIKSTPKYYQDTEEGYDITFMSNRAQAPKYKVEEQVIANPNSRIYST